MFSDDEGVSQLEAIRARVRALAVTFGWVADGLRTGFAKYVALQIRHAADSDEIRVREKQLARAVLLKGHLVDPEIDGFSKSLFVSFQGLRPAALQVRLAKHKPGTLPPSLERSAAKAALLAFDRYQRYENAQGSLAERMAAQYRGALSSGRFIDVRWMVQVRQPDDWDTPPNPGSDARADLDRFNESEFLAIVLYRLGGLADTGSVRQIVPKPSVGVTTMDQWHEFLAWYGRFPVRHGERELDDPPLEPRLFAPNVATQFLQHFETWVRREAVKRRVDLSAPSEGARLAIVESPISTDFRPAAWFGKSLAARLRMAASRGRKKKRVDSRVVDGVRLYSVVDARRWWPGDVPKDK